MYRDKMIEIADPRVCVSSAGCTVRETSRIEKVIPLYLDSYDNIVRVESKMRLHGLKTLGIEATL